MMQFSEGGSQLFLDTLLLKCFFHASLLFLPSMNVLITYKHASFSNNMIASKLQKDGGKTPIFQGSANLDCTFASVGAG
jgi:hypothetical protein